MSILIGKYEFEVPGDVHDIPHEPGLYAILIEQNQDLLLVEIHDTNNLALTLGNRVLKRNDRSIVYLVCPGKSERQEALGELLREFEFEHDEPVQSGHSKRSETNTGIAVAL